MVMLIKGARLLDGERADITIENGMITRLTAGTPANGESGVPAHEETEVIEAYGLVVVPGLVDAHRHVWQAPLRGIGADMTLPDYLTAVVGRATSTYGPADVRLATLLGAAEAIDAGITTVFDWNHLARDVEHTEAAIDAYATAGIRAVVACSAEGVKRVADLQGRVTGALTTLGPEHGTWEDTVRQIELARDLGLVVSMHVGAGPGSPLDRLHEAGLLGPEVQLVHANQVTADQAALLAGAGVRVVVTPVVEATMGHGPSAYSRLLAAGLRPDLGTDVVVNAPLDLFEPMRETLRQHRRSTGTTTPAAEILAAATGGGTVAVGAPADLVLLDGLAHLGPGDDVAGAVVTTCRPSDVHTVVVDGRVVKRDGRLVGLDLAVLRAGTADLAGRMRA